MPVAVYHNNGTGRDGYVNGLGLVTASQRELSNANAAASVNSFWPNEALERHRQRHFDTPLSSTLSFGTSLPIGSPSSSPLSARQRLPAVPKIHSTTAAGGRYKSPKRELWLGGSPDGFAALGSPRSLPTSSRYGASPPETTLQFAQRTGRFATPRDAPPQSPRLPGLRLHQTVGILDEI